MTRAVLVALLVAMGSPVGSPLSQNANYSQGPVRLNLPTTTIMVTAPDELAEHGVSFVQLRMTSPSALEFDLFDEKRELLGHASVRSSTDLAHSSTRSRYEVTLSGVTEWLEEVSAETPSRRVVRYTSSDGADINVELVLGARRKGKAAAVPIEEVVVTDNETGLMTGDREDLKSLDARTFTTARLKLLGKLAKNASRMWKVAIEAERMGLPEASAAFAGCTAHCVRVVTLLPLYWCDDGAYHSGTGYGCCSLSSGWWTIQSCGFFLTCDLECSEFGIIA